MASFTAAEREWCRILLFNVNELKLLNSPSQVTGVISDDGFMDKTDDMENDFGAMAISANPVKSYKSDNYSNGKVMRSLQIIEISNFL